MAEDRTTIQVSTGVWRWLNGRKRPGESFDDVLRRELGVPEDESGGAPELPEDYKPTYHRVLCGLCGRGVDVARLPEHFDSEHPEFEGDPYRDPDHDLPAYLEKAGETLDDLLPG